MSHFALPEVVQGIHVAGEEGTVLAHGMEGSIKRGDYGGEGEMSTLRRESNTHAVQPCCRQLSLSPLHIPLKKFKKREKIYYASKAVMSMRHRESRREGVSERDEECCNRVRECKREREHVTSADQSPPSASGTESSSFNLRGIISTGWKLHVSLYWKQESFYTPLSIPEL